MKIITINVNKGGPGKTTFAKRFAEYLRRTKRVLLLDFDDSANLTNCYGYFDNYENTIINLFDKGNATPVNVAHNLDLIAGHREVELLKEKVNSKRRREELFGRWLAENESELESKYDYIIIDTENDEGILTQNAIIVSDLVIGIAEASKDSFLALSNLREFVNDLNHDFDGNTQLAFVANKINLAERASIELLEDLQEYPEYIGYLPRRTILTDETPIFSGKLIASHQIVREQMCQVFEHVLSLLDRNEEVSYG